MISKQLKKSVGLCIIMVVAAGLTIAATPTKRLSEESAKIHLEQMIPASFAGWKVDPSVGAIVVAPDVRAQLDRLYDQTLSRTYVSSTGRRMMLSIAYGGDQSDAMQVHRPEVCYTAQGFHIVREAFGTLITEYGQLPVKRLLAVMGRRSEPITYWVIVGDRATRVGLRQKLLQLRYGLTGTIPDGLLIRVSSIGEDEANAYKDQEHFVRLMLGAMRDADRLKITGRFDA